MFKTILLPTDRSEYSKKAMEHVVELAEKFNSRVVLLHVYDVPDEFADRAMLYDLDDAYLTGIEKNLREYGHKLLDDIKVEMKSKGVEAETMLKKGKAGPAIKEAIGEINGDLVVMGSRGLGLVKRFVLGSVSNYVIHHTTCPVLIVH